MENVEVSTSGGSLKMGVECHATVLGYLHNSRVAEMQPENVSGVKTLMGEVVT